MSDRYLIINADDFGLCLETNDAIEHLFREGRITSTTVMAPAMQSGDAIERALCNNHIKMGLHITLNSDFVKDKWKSIAPVTEVPSLLDEEKKFYHDINCFYHNAKEEEVAIEVNAQYQYVANLGYQPTHADSHCGTLYGLAGRSFMKEAYELCVRYNLPFRFPKSKDFLKIRFGGNVPPELDQAHTNAVDIADRLGISLPNDIITNPFGKKDIESYEQLKEFYLTVIRNLKEGITELFLHPSKSNEVYMSSTPDWQKRIWEYQFLMDDDMIKALQQEGINLVSWDNAPFEAFR